MKTKTGLFNLIVILLMAGHSWGIIIRDDRDDSKYKELGKNFSAVGIVLPRAGAGTLIAPQWVLTAAHVAASLKMPATIAFDGTNYTVQDRTLYPGWKDGEPNDIALLKLAQPVQGVAPVSPYTSTDEVGQTVTLVGYGGTGTGLTGRRNEDGAKRAATNKIEGADHEWLTFTFDPPGAATGLEGISGPGDSGSPALLQKDGKWFVAGVSVWGDSGGKTPGMYGQKEGYTRVSSYAQWVVTAMSAESSGKSTQDRAVVATDRKTPETEQGKTVAGYLQAFNSGDDAVMDGFQQAHMSPETLKKRTTEQRLQMYHMLRGDLGTVRLMKVLEGGPDQVSAFVLSSKNEWVRFDFEFEKGVIAGIGVEQSEGPDQEGAAEALSESQLLTSVEKYVGERAGHDEFSGVVLLAKDGKPVFEKAYGLASKKYNVPNRIDTKFNVGSINKSFTSVAIAQLAKDGKLKLDDTMDKYLADFPKEKASKITIRQLLNHQSGLGDFFGERYMTMSKGMLRRNSDFIPLFIDNPLEFEPGSDQRYSNAGYVMLGAIIEKVSGQSYYDYVREHIFKPLGMLDTDSYAIDDETPNIATGYTRHRDDENLPDTVERRSNVETLPARGSAAGGGYSTAGDLLKFVLALQNNTISLPPEKGETESGPAAFAFAGGSPGVNAVVASFPAKGYVVVVLSNYDPSSAESVEKKIGGWIRSLK
jgi:CubicO group peptidase (beta-lactamase class C family)/V8-like Glu-specific endopeptidase